MIILLSPAKNLNFNNLISSEKTFTKPEYIKESTLLVNKIKRLSAPELMKLMKINEKLAALNHDRYQKWSLPFNTNNSRPAIYAFNGDVYLGLNAWEFSENDMEFAQDHLRILSGLYGILRPLDLIQPYRMEMGLPFSFDGYSNLYQFWNDKLTPHVNKLLKKQSSKVIINLASDEYWKVIDLKSLKYKVVTPVFKEEKNGKFKPIHVYLKKARGLMARFIIQNRIEEPEDIKAFDPEGYYFNESLSKGSEWVFTR